MANRLSDRPIRPLVLAVAIGALAWPVAAQRPAGQGPAGAKPGSDSPLTTQQTSERLEELRKEADALASRQRTLLAELRKLEIERQISLERLKNIERERAKARQELESAEARAADLARRAEGELPDVEARLVHLYKLGRGGYWRLLLSVDDLQALGRAYRLVGSLTAIDRARVTEYYATLDALALERKTLQARHDELSTLQAEAARTRAALDSAVQSRTALVNSIDARRDLNAQLSGELQAAQEKLQASIAQMEAGRTPAPAALSPFGGGLPWPARGPVSRPFGRGSAGSFGGAVVRNGMEIGTPEGQPVRSVQAGTVAFADTFAGYGNLVILEHAGGAYSLYGYLASVEVSRGDRIDREARVGTSGVNPSGNPALYFELRVDGEAVDPVHYLSGAPDQAPR